MKDRKQAKKAAAPAWKAGRRKEQITIGLDLGDKTSRCCAIDKDGDVLFERSVVTSKKGMAQFFGTLGRCRVALEALE